MKVLGFANLFVRKVIAKDGKVYTFPELSISSKDKDGKFVSINVKASFQKDLVDIDALEDSKCYNIDIKDGILNVDYDEYKKAKVLKIHILDFEFVKTVDLKQKQDPAPKKKLPK